MNAGVGYRVNRVRALPHPRNTILHNDGDSDVIASALKELGIQQSSHSHSGLNAELIALGATSLITAAVFLIDLMLLVPLTSLRDSFKAMARSRA